MTYLHCKSTFLLLVLFFLFSKNSIAQSNNLITENLQSWITSSEHVTIPHSDSLAFFDYYAEGKGLKPVAKKMYSLYKVLFNEQISIIHRVRVANYYVEAYASENPILPMELIYKQISSLKSKIK
ncbi:MAG: hypothetical protein R2831_00145 [Chitinophagaceae bacterium]